MSQPVITHIGHAGIRYKYQGVTVTLDPWFYPAFLQSWFPYPDNRRFLDAALDSDYIYLSHAHEDHFDRKFLAAVDPTRTTLIIPNFRSRYLEKEVRKLGFDGQLGPIVLNHGERTVLPGGISLTMLIDRSHKEDSALLLEAGGFRFLDSNDCELAIPDWPKDITLLAAQFSGASWYPHCYDFDSQVMSQKTREVRQGNFDRLVRRVQLTGARAYMPSAGPAVFLDPALDGYNVRGGSFPLWYEVRDEFALRCPEVHVYPYLCDYGDIREYRSKRRSEWGRYYDMPDTFVTEEELNAHFRYLQACNKRFLRNWRKDISMSSSSWIAGDARRWSIKLGLVAGELEETFDPTYFMDVPPRVLRAVVDGRITWETALHSMRVKLRRDPDVYDSTLMGLLAFGDRPVQTLTMARQQAGQEMITHYGVTHQRWCPHAGEDLTYATVENGLVTCPRHQWRWDARTGDCVEGGDIPLKIDND